MTGEKTGINKGRGSGDFDSPGMLREAIDGSPDSIIIFGEDERVVYSNPTYHKIYPHSPPQDQIVGWKMEDLFRCSIEGGHIDDPKAVADPEAWIKEQVRIRRQEGKFARETTHTNGRSYLLMHHRIKGSGTLVTHTDITEIKEARDKLAELHDQLEAKVEERTSELKRSEERYRALFEYANDAVFIVEPEERRIIDVNTKAVERLGYTKEELLTMRVDDINVPEAMAAMKSDIKSQATNQDGKVFERLHRRKDGSTYPVEISSHFLEYDGKKHLQAFARDITERKQAEERVRFTQFSVDNADESMFWMTHDGKFFYVNDAACRRLGYSAEELMSMSVFDIGDISEEEWTIHWRALKENGRICRESLHRRKDGTVFPVHISANFLEYEGNEYNFAFVEDITERKQAEEDLRHLATHDQVTGLPNRALAIDHLELFLARAERTGSKVGVMFMDLDGFKAVNDTHGHEAGDLVLKELGRRFLSGVRKSDTVARFGGDEFLVLLSEADDLPAVKRIADQLRRAAADPVELDCGTFHLGVSIGIALHPEDGETADDLINGADDAMYKAKAIGGRTHVFASDHPDESS